MLFGINIPFHQSLSCLYHLSSQDKFDCTSTSYLCLSDHPPICLSFHPSLALLTVPSAPSFCPSVCLSSCLSCPGCVDSSSVSCRRSVLLRHGHWSDACTLSADGQATILFHTFSFPSKVYFTRSLTCHSSQSLFFCHQSPSPSSFIADHLVAGKLTERETGRGRQIGNIQSLEGFCSESLPAKPKAPFLSSSCPPCCACTYTPSLPVMICPRKWRSLK